MPRLVVDLVDRRPFLRAPTDLVERLTAVLPPDWEVVAVEDVADGSGDGGTVASPPAITAVRDAEVYLGFGVPASILESGPRLRWVHSATAGIGSSLTPAMLARDVTFTNSAGVHAVPIAEWILGAMLYFTRGFDLAARAKAEARWDKGPFDVATSPVREIADTTVGIVGMGGIGRAVAARAGALGARVLGLRRRPDDGPPGVEILTGSEGLRRLLAVSDFVVLTAPETPETRGMIDAVALERMPAGSVLVNVSRGGLVVERDLVEALSSGRLRGAALDVFSAEPLPSASELWRLPNVLVTPHVSSYTPRFWDRELALVQENLRRFLAGEPLRNVVDRTAGY